MGIVLVPIGFAVAMLLGEGRSVCWDTPPGVSRSRPSGSARWSACRRPWSGSHPARWRSFTGCGPGAGAANSCQSCAL